MLIPKSGLSDITLTISFSISNYLGKSKMIAPPNVLLGIEEYAYILISILEEYLQ